MVNTVVCVRDKFERETNFVVREETSVAEVDTRNEIVRGTLHYSLSPLLLKIMLKICGRNFTLHTLTAISKCHSQQLFQFRRVPFARQSLYTINSAVRAGLRYLRFEILAALSVRIAVFWDLTS
jgi:hypothetical protein